MNNEIEKVKKILVDFKQEHLLQFIDELSLANRKKLVNQISSINFTLVNELFRNSTVSITSKPFVERNITPINCDIIEEFSESKLMEYRKKGINAICEGRIASVTMAGGQGTRLGYNGPKGTFQIGPPIKKTLFQLQVEKLKNIHQECGKWVPWYIMTSNENHNDTIKYFSDNKYFGYSEKDILFFMQGMLPMVDFNGKVLLKEKDEIYFGPDGNGGIFLSLKKYGLLQDMNLRGVEWVFINGIDNALVKVADPVFIGYTTMLGKSSASKSVAKKSPDEAVGVFCLENGKPSIIEYTEIPETLTKEVNDDGQLLFGDANIIAHLFRLDDIVNIAEMGLPYHSAIKKASYIDKNGKKIVSQEPNAYKFESFIFDAFKYLNNMGILRVQREREFAPIKNSIGKDSPEAALEQLMLYPL
ncbi:UDPGP type 1 family protein [Clostridium zeae]|uniref:UDPGP type 1 family protein n=1 Tax=Clostridium zeae TaxID=2759022 RepID=A0ABQ1EER4_9CLOT|nr:UDPGP type 1 family protein [Clostridium zeae]GFZ33275.1 UDPGP type 1 family protein [Clostridium zeae]